LFNDVKPVLEGWKSASITVVAVSNNATEAVKRALEKNGAEHLVDYVIGREYRHEMVGNLKPQPLLLKKALEISGCGADTALLVGDSVDDMRAGQAAKIGFIVGLLQHSTASEQQLRNAGAKLVLGRFGDLETNKEVQRLLHGVDASNHR
jgi:phosphoglycolate phosphatase-like HAD superfamily hydrolase